MSVLNPGTTFQNGEQLTADLLNNLVSQATFTDASIDNQSTEISGASIIVKDEGIIQSKIAPGAVVFTKLAPAMVINSNTMSGASSTTLATSGSIKAYVDAEVAKYSTGVTAYKSSFVACPLANSSAVFAHSLGAVPDIVNVQLKCIFASSGFAVGDIVILANTLTPGGSIGQCIEIDATNVTFHVGPGGLYVISPAGTAFYVAETNFEVKVTAAIL